MTNDTEPRALSAALAAPAFVTRSMGSALHAANRHVERWAPEADVSRVRPMRSLSFVDRLVAPWMETAQRSASMRLFSQYAAAGMRERGGPAVSWVFPRPWYQDELDWMAAARQVRTLSAQSSRPAAAPTLLTTRGTYVPPAIAAPQLAMPSALYEYVAPSLSLAAAQPAGIPGVGFGGETLARGEAYSPLVSLASVQAAELMSRAVSPLAARRTSAPVAGMPARPLMATSAMTPGLRSVLTTILERAAAPPAVGLPPSRLAMSAPHLETPPAPRDDVAPVARSVREPSQASASATQVADQYAEQRTHIVELQRIAQQSAQRDVIARAEIARTQAAQSPATTQAAQSPATTQAAQSPATTDVRASAERAEAELRERIATARGETIVAAQERARVEQRIAQRLAERTGGQRLHEQARAEAAAHVRTPIEPAPAAAAPIAPTAPTAVPTAYRPSPEVAAAIAGLPPELAAMLAPIIAQRPERAMQAILELNDTLRTVELLARSSAAGTAFEATRGPRLVMPAGLGGLVNAVDRAQSIAERPAMLAGERPLAPLAQFVEPQVATPAAREQARPARDVRMPTLAWLSPAARSQAMSPVTALGATAGATPAALSHVAWADRWLARFAGATPQSLDMISAAAAAAPEARLQALANAAPGAVFVAPELLRGDLAGERARSRSSATASAASSGAYAASQASQASASAASQASASSSAAASASQTGASQPPAASSGPPSQVPGLRLINPAPGEPLRRFDDDAETPDDVFAAISASAARNRSAASRAQAAPGSIVAQAHAAAQATQAAQAQAPAFDRSTLADLVAHSAPSAPGAGLSAQLSSSPFAPALRHILPFASSASFDVRALFGAGLGATYLAGLIGPSSRELEIGTHMAPAWASWSDAPLNQQADADRPDRLDRMVPSFDATYVRPDALDVLDPRAPGSQGITASGEQLRGGEPVRAGEQVRAGEPLGAGEPGAGSTAAPAASLTTLRTALLSWDVTTTASDVAGAPPVTQLVPGAFATAHAPARASAGEAAYTVSAARMMIEAMSLPMLGDTEQDRAPAWGAPGMVADRAHAWSIAQERSASDLALDFVTPELVLAARVYGLGPAEAAQAARLAIAGPGQLGAMASTVDRTFVEAMAIGRDARNVEAERSRRVASSAGEGGGLAPRAADRASSATMPMLAGDERAAITTAFPAMDGTIAAAIAPTLRAALPPASGSSFGVDRRAPRGAFLWPAATVAALGLNAAGSDGQLSMSVAALEMLAAQVVVELGTYTALSAADAAARGIAGEPGVGGSYGAGSYSADSYGADAPGAAAASGAAGVSGAASPDAAGLAGRRDAVGTLATFASHRAASDAAGTAEPGEADVLGAAAALVPASRRARFDALYVALSQSNEGRSWSPAARAARALALAGRGEGSAITARERATSAWDVLPVVYPGVPGDAADSSELSGGPSSAASSAAALMSSYVSLSSPGTADGRRGTSDGRRSADPARRGTRVADAGDSMIQVTRSPGLEGLSARAGNALGAYVSAAAPPSAPVEHSSNSGTSAASHRAPTAAPEYVQTSRSGGRYGGGEVEIPSWFEAAARKMLSERSGDSDGISLAELTLVTAAPSSHIAASSVTPSAPSPTPPGAATTSQSANAPKIDVEKIANELYHEVMTLMDVARSRNGNPYQ